MMIETLSQNFRKSRSVNQTSASFVAKVPTITEPSGDAATATGACVFDIGVGGEYVQNFAHFLFYGTGTNNQTLSARIYIWRHVIPVTTKSRIYIPVLLCEVLCTLSSNIPGIAGADIVATELFADTITVVGTSGNTDVSIEIVSPADDANAAQLIVDLKGGKKLEPTFSVGTATDANALFALL